MLTVIINRSDYVSGFSGEVAFLWEDAGSPLKILLITKGLSPWMEPFPPSSVKPTPAAPLFSPTVIGAPCTAAETQSTPAESCLKMMFTFFLDWQSWP